MVEAMPDPPDNSAADTHAHVTPAHGPQGGEVTRDGSIVHPAVSYERTDVRSRGVLVVMLAAVAIVSATLLGVWFFFRGYESHQANIKKSPYPLAPGPITRLPDGPRLEQVDRLAGNDEPDVFLREKSREAVLHSTGPTSEPGFVHIPIERAMQLIVDELPVRRETKEGPVKDAGLLDGGGPNSGRLYREGPK
jgi:hypothetical protein